MARTRVYVKHIDVGAVSRAISQWIGMILYGFQTIGHTWVFPLR